MMSIFHSEAQAKPVWKIALSNIVLLPASMLLSLFHLEA